MKMARNGLTLALAAVLVLGSQIVIPQASFAAGQSAQTDTNIQADLQNQLKKFKDVQVSVKNGVVDLEGTVKDFATKEEIDKKAHRIKNVAAVRNKLKIAGAGDISDAQLQQKIVQKLQYDRVGYGNAFNAISVNVQDGVVTLGGNALGPVAADSAVSLASHFPGVQDVIDNISGRSSLANGRSHPAPGVCGHLRFSQPQQVRYRPGAADSHNGGERQRHPEWRGHQPGR